MPRFDEPTYTMEAAHLFDGAPPIDDLGALPRLDEPAEGRVAVDSAEPLVRVEHRRVRVLANYWHAGWSTAVAGTWLRSGVADRLYAVADALPERWGLAVFDAWRPLELQVQLYEASVADPEIEPGFMAPPSSDAATPPPHLTGGAVDLTLTWDGTPIAAGTGFDDTTRRAFVAALEDEPGPARHVRRALFHRMAAQGFVVYRGEWWHFEWGTRRWAGVRGESPIYGPTSPGEEMCRDGA